MRGGVAVVILALVLFALYRSQPAEFVLHPAGQGIRTRNRLHSS
ncbi:hypothetical protein [Arthrobacter sp. ISL-28]|nr:hypothetical protein [Arthrobacter sp. ISL-28]